jgi:hypothetical protein
MVLETYFIPTVWKQMYTVQTVNSKSEGVSVDENAHTMHKKFLMRENEVIKRLQLRCL